MVDSKKQLIHSVRIDCKVQFISRVDLKDT